VLELKYIKKMTIEKEHSAILYRDMLKVFKEMDILGNDLTLDTFSAYYAVPK